MTCRCLKGDALARKLLDEAAREAGIVIERTGRAPRLVAVRVLSDDPPFLPRAALPAPVGRVLKGRQMLAPPDPSRNAQLDTPLKGLELETDQFDQLCHADVLLAQ